MRKIVLTYGLIAGGMLSVMMLATLPFMDRIGFQHGMWIGYTTMVAAFLLVYFGVRAYRDTVTGGTLTFGQGLKAGLLIVLVASTCYVITWEFIYYFLTPDFLEKYAAYELDVLRRDGASDSALVAKREELASFAELYRNPLVNIGATFMEPLPVGVLAAVLSAVGLRKGGKAA